MARRAIRVLAAMVAATLTACGTGGSPDPGSTTTTTTPGLEGSGVVGTRAADVPCTVPNDTPGVAVIADRDRLVLPDGRALPLTSVAGGAVGGYQTCDGWLVHGRGDGPGPYSLWLVHVDGSLTEVVTAADAPVAVAPDGRHLAWRWEGQLLAGRVHPSQPAIIDTRSPAPDRGHPISMTESVVILGYSATGGGIDHHDVWTPVQGDYVPTWDAAEHVRVLYGPAPNGGQFLGLVVDPAQNSGVTRPCLAELDPQGGLRTGRTACGLDFTLDRFSDIDPDGRRLAVYMRDENGDRSIGLVDLTTVFSSPTFDAVLSGPPATDGAFEDATHVLVANIGGGMVRFESPFGAWAPAARPGVNESTQITALLRRLV